MPSASPVTSTATVRRTSLLLLAFGALGVVYGDIGTSVLYSVNEIFFGHGGILASRENVIGAIGLVLWALILIVAIKYHIFVLRADNDGEGGVFALYGLLSSSRFIGTGMLLLLLVFAASLLVGDGMITPAISVLAAVEGLNVATKTFTPYVVPLTIAILVALFSIQFKGTARVGKIFGPITLIWFITIGALGALRIAQEPGILQAFNPLHIMTFVEHAGIFRVFLVLGSVMLVMTGTEALYADMGHFGSKAIQIGWFVIAGPALALNYLGQGAYLLSGRPIMNGNIFYSLVPTIGAEKFLHPFAGFLPQGILSQLSMLPLYAMVILATMVTVIASQALITGIFSLSAQAAALGLSPRFKIVHTNATEHGQIYLPAVNWALCAGCVLLVMGFKASTNLAAAYGLAVSGVMLITSIAMIYVARGIWQWGMTKTVLVFGTFLAIDAVFLAANILKFAQGGYVPVIIATMAFSVFLTWRWGRRLMKKAYSTYAGRSVEWLIALKEKLVQADGILEDRVRRRLVEIDRAVVFMSARPVNTIGDNTPVTLRMYLKRTGAIPKYIIILTIIQEKVPYVPRNDSLDVKSFGANVWTARARYGFMQTPDLPSILRELHAREFVGTNLHRCIIETGEEDVIIHRNTPFFMQALARFYRLLMRLSTPPHRYFGADRESGLSKTLLPVAFDRKGYRVEIPEFAWEPGEENIDPDTRKPTDLRFLRS